MKNNKPVSSYFGENTFDIKKLLKNTPKKIHSNLQNAINQGEKILPETSDAVAIALRKWAVSKGCTHYTHWFQPMTGYTAEKHDSFIDYDGNGGVIEKFTGKQLTQGEPDASSFPSGGIRATFEARGYTIWDPTSPAFIIEYPHGNTLCIPTVFVSYTGETLDRKAPLLRSIQVLNNAALEILKIFNHPAKKVFSTLGVEQEYFLIDRNYYKQRPDLIQTGRTLFGKMPEKHQQLEDQYFANIPERAFAFMSEIEEESYKLGIPLKTRHNEVAPNQFEFAPIYEDVNIAIDHNQILMDLMERIAKRHNLTVLLHEKPFAGINGSGKHANWSISTDTGENLLFPGNTPESNLQFLVFLISTIKAVYNNSKLLRASVASCSNDYRLGANEAPPAIISIFLGETLSKVLSDLGAGKVTKTKDQSWISFGIDKIPEISKDSTDRNRTSPFAFTGNKFEFRAVGSSATPSTSITILNSIIANSLLETNAQIKSEVKKSKDLNKAIVRVLRKIYNETKSILFEGDNYSASWEKVALKRGLPNLKTAPDALKALIEKKSIKLLENLKIFNPREVESRFEVDMENYCKNVDIEAKVSVDMSLTMFYPAGIKYLNDLLSTLTLLKNNSSSSLNFMIKDLSKKLDDCFTEIKNLEKMLKSAHSIKDTFKRGKYFESIKVQCLKLRITVDNLETIIPNNLWPVPKYKELLLNL
ncbi:MAG: glutamine synthetase III [Bacteroidetes bacterium]|nr:glutamine synthetase III [Bacteroidota bacterium]